MNQDQISSDILLKLLSDISMELSFCEDSFNKSVNVSLKIIGEVLDVSRVYVFEDSEDGKHTNNTHEWCAPNVTAQIENLQEISYEDLPSFIKTIDNTGRFIANNVTKLEKGIREELESQNIKSILIFQLIYEGKKIGFIGLDETRDFKEWKQTEIDIVQTISFLLSNTFSRNFAKKKLEAKLEDIQSMNDAMVARELKMIQLKAEIKDMESAK